MAAADDGEAGPLPGALPITPTIDPEWIIVEDGFTLAREHEVELLFAIGNGYVGSRGSLAEGSALSAPATFIAGVYDCESGSAPALALLTDWTRLSATIDGRFGWIEDTISSIAGFSTCGREPSGASGDVRTKPVG